MLYKCVKGKEIIDSNEYIIPTKLASRGHNKKLHMKRLKKDVRKFCISTQSNRPVEHIARWSSVCQEHSQVQKKI